MKRRYLLVDDNQAFVENLAEILEDTGAAVDVAEDAERALEMLGAHQYDVLVTDMRLPGMSGTELLRRARALDAALPVVLLSAYVQDAQISDARREGLLAVMSKPGKVPQLVGILEGARRGGIVLLVEDDAALAENLIEALGARGITVCTAATVKELDRVEVKPFAALVDLKLPDGGAGESLERVRRLFPGTPTLVITGGPTPGILGEAELYKKPFDTVALVAHLERLLAQVVPA